MFFFINSNIRAVYAIAIVVQCLSMDFHFLFLSFSLPLSLSLSLPLSSFRMMTFIRMNSVNVSSKKFCNRMRPKFSIAFTFSGISGTFLIFYLAWTTFWHKKKRENIRNKQTEWRKDTHLFNWVICVCAK